MEHQIFTTKLFSLLYKNINYKTAVGFANFSCNNLCYWKWLQSSACISRAGK